MCLKIHFYTIRTFWGILGIWNEAHFAEEREKSYSRNYLALLKEFSSISKPSHAHSLEVPYNKIPKDFLSAILEGGGVCRQQVFN